MAYAPWKYKVLKFAPRPVKRAYKVLKIISRQPHKSKPLSDEIFQDCKVLGSRESMLPLLPQNGVVAEIGVLHGDFTKKIIKDNAPKNYIGIDVDLSGIDQSIQTTETTNVSFKKGRSYDVLNEFEDAYFDWIYIDGDHSYEGVKKDIDAAQAKVKPGGYLVFNDFAHIAWSTYSTYGVHRAVTEFLEKNKWPVKFWTYQSDGAYDLAIQRPA